MKEKKFIVIGASGMLGHVVSIYFKQKYPNQVVLCSRKKTGINVIDQKLLLIDLSNLSQIEEIIRENRPCILINCLHSRSKNETEMSFINSSIPHIFVNFLNEVKDHSKIIQISTDGVFSGKKGGYLECDFPDAEDSYGKSKIKGEIISKNNLTIRTSIIGHSINGTMGLLDWFLSQTGKVDGYINYFWSGVTTLELAKFVDYSITSEITGLVHLSSNKISKYHLLNNFKDTFNKNDVTVSPLDYPKKDLSLLSLRNEIVYPIPSLKKMLEEIK